MTRTRFSARTAPRVLPGQQQPGDLVFFAGSDGTPRAPGHVGILVSTSLLIDAPYAGMPVRLDPVTGEVGFARPGKPGTGGAHVEASFDTERHDAAVSMLGR
jgi:cell wall-associated NlpC family hydrolase